MNRKALIIGACVILGAAIGFVLARASGGDGTKPTNPWTVSFPMPASNVVAASQTNMPPKQSR